MINYQTSSYTVLSLIYIPSTVVGGGQADRACEGAAGQVDRGGTPRHLPGAQDSHSEEQVRDGSKLAGTTMYTVQLLPI